MSDLHITEYGSEIWKTDTKSHFDRAIEQISQMDDIDCIIVTGDLSNDGSQWSYSYIDNAFKSIGIPTICCPGNHDNIVNLKKMNYCSFKQIVHINGWKLLNLDSTIPNMGRGRLNSETLDYIDNELSTDNAPTIIAFHHPSVEPGGWLDRKLLEDRDSFNQYITQKNNVKLVLYGHSHYAIAHKIGATIFSSAPSIGFAFNKELPKFQIAKGEEGFNIIEIEGECISIKTIRI